MAHISPRTWRLVRQGTAGPRLALAALLCWILPCWSLPAAYAQEAAPSLDPRKALTQYGLDAWTTADGLPQNTVSAVVQTRDGYLWLGTQEGLARFDGIRFHVYDRNSAGLTSDDVSALVEDAGGALWFGTRRGGLGRLHEGRLTRYTTADGLGGDQVSALAASRDGGVWVGTYRDGLSHYRPDGDGRFVVLTTRQGLPSDKVSAVVEGRDGTLWVGTRDAGLARLQGGHLTRFTAADGLPSDDVSALAEGRGGVLWVGTREAGLARIGADGRLTRFTTAEGLSSSGVTALYEDRAGTLWIGTQHGGLVRLCDGRFSTLTTADGLVQGWVKSIGEDREGSLWIGTEGGGLNRLRDLKFTTFAEREGLADDLALSVYEDAGGDVWIGTEGGLSRLHAGTGARFTTYRAADGLSSDLVYSVYGTRDGALWAGTSGAGLNRYAGGRFTTFTTRDGLPDDAVFALLEDASGTLWAGTNGGLARYRPGTGAYFVPFTESDGLASNYVTTLAEDPGGDLWVGTYDAGLDRLRTDADGRTRVVAHYDTGDGLLTDFVLALYADADGTLWIGTREGGLHRLRDGRLTAIGMAGGRLNDTIHQILEDGRGWLWMSSNRGLFRVEKTALDALAEGRAAAVAPVVYGTRDGLRTQEFNGGLHPAGWKGRDGRLWFPSSRGVVAVDPARIPVNAQAPPVVVEAVLADGVPVAAEGRAVLPPGRSRFEFHYAGLSLLVPEAVRYRYMLEGIDTAWVDAGTRREAFYTNLAPGSYTFRVVAFNNDGVPSAEPAVVSFYLRPAFYQTAWFYLAVAVALAAAVAGMHRLRVRRLEVRQRALERLVDERTRSLRQEKEKTEAAKRIIEGQAERLRELDGLKTRFFNNISHEFRTPLTLNIGPLENALAGAYGPLPEAMRRQVDVMLRNARRLLRLLNQLLDLAKLEAGRMRLQVRQTDLVPLVEGVVLSFTAFAEKEDVVLAFAADRAALPLAADPEALEKVFFNLLSNAVKFTPPGGAIRVSVAARVEEVDGVPRERAEVRVADTGPGIPPDEIPRLFDRYHQVGAASRVQQGTGIGLALVKELVDLHGGTIGVESEVDVGTVFTLRLPLDLADVEALVGTAGTDGVSHGVSHGVLHDVLPSVSHSPMVELAVFDGDEPQDAPPAAPPPGARTVLVVDDNADVRDYVAGCLSPAYRVETASDGPDALARAAVLRPDLVVSDVAMPGMTGYELCRALKADSALGHTPVILLTSRASVDDKIKGLEAGADDYLTKPFDARELLVRAGNLLTLRAQQRDLRRLNDELHEVNASLQQTMETKSQVVRIVVHDLKSPLGAVREFARMAKEDLEGNARVAGVLDVIQSAAERMLYMVGQLLDSETLESGHLKLEPVPLDVAGLAADVVRDFEHQAGQKGQTLAFTAAAPGACLVEADTGWLREAMENLLSNAVKYSPPGKPIRVTVDAGDDCVRFAVRDEGPGLTDDDKARLFQKFQRLSARPTGGESSTGLGLSIVHQIVELHGGRIRVDGAPGAGSTFTIELPRVEAPVPAP